MTLDEYIQKLEAAQKVLPDMISVAAKNATIRAVEAAQEKYPAHSRQPERHQHPHR